MHNFEIIPDSSSDLTEPLRKRFGINHILRGVVYKPDGTEMLADIDWQEMSPEEYFNSMKGRNVLYKTATPPVGNITKTFEDVLKAGKDILSISLSTKISGTFQTVKNAADELIKKYPDRKIICIDSLRYSGAISLLVHLASEKRATGATIEETAEYINQIKHSVHQIGPLDDLFFCVKTGRISNLTAFLGTMVGVNSLADFSNKGLTAIIGKVKGKKAALDVTLKYLYKTIKNPQEQIIFISHSIREESANYLAENIKENLHPKDVIINSIGMSCGSSIGPGLCAVYYLGNPISDDEVLEREIFNDILKSK